MKTSCLIKCILLCFLISSCSAMEKESTWDATEIKEWGGPARDDPKAPPSRGSPAIKKDFSSLLQTGGHQLRTAEPGSTSSTTHHLTEDIFEEEEEQPRKNLSARITDSLKNLSEAKTDSEGLIPLQIQDPPTPQPKKAGNSDFITETLSILPKAVETHSLLQLSTS
ncbi:hypothetical protein FA10DRAFT_302334 [Acaromyces ingoldii]|uniref:Uncharacterized protein n=1 Tax=Acaromyces ingoldii TaxID=215250 RepID=A0A316YHB7_9BASI|nr:hypothetical protein FA10DRAFT_302334 [Acaromyces ingoldii]PWN88940.1 hypothetical protein FA10DRAFT_302334 [Acaromyces ingoldii]